MTKTIHGIQWRVRCPSYYEVEGYPQVNLAYLGGDLGWHLTAPDSCGKQITRPFPKEKAFAIVAEAFK